MFINARRTALSVVACAVVYSAVIAGTDTQATLRAVTQLAATGWLLVLALSVLNYALRFVRWHGYLRCLGHRVPVEEHALIYTAGFAFTTTPGKMGEALRSLYLKPLGVPYTHSLAALFVERLLDLLAMILLASLALLRVDDQQTLLLGLTLIVLMILLWCGIRLCPGG